ncbi:5752_t:CDS:2, partial [Gigaspora rosea]
MPYSKEQLEQRRQCNRFIYRECRARKDKEQQEQRRERNRQAQYRYHQKQKHHFQGRNKIDETTIVPFHLKPTIICIHFNTETPAALKDLFTRMDIIGYDFRNNIQAYNNLFAFISLGVHLDQQFANGKNGIYTFRAQG